MSNHDKPFRFYVKRGLCSAFGVVVVITVLLSLSEIPDWVEKWGKIFKTMDQTSINSILYVLCGVILIASNAPWISMLLRRSDSPTQKSIADGGTAGRVAVTERVLPPVPIHGIPHAKVPPKPRATLQELREQRIEGKSFYIWELLIASGGNNQIVGKHIESCDIKGPAIVRIEGKYTVGYCSFGGLGVSKFEDVVWLVPQTHSGCGVIYLKGCTLLKCRFEFIGIAITRGEKLKFGESMTYLPT